MFFITAAGQSWPLARSVHHIPSSQGDQETIRCNGSTSQNPPHGGKSLVYRLGIQNYRTPSWHKPAGIKLEWGTGCFGAVDRGNAAQRAEKKMNTFSPFAQCPAVLGCILLVAFIHRLYWNTFIYWAAASSQAVSEYGFNDVFILLAEVGERVWRSQGRSKVQRWRQQEKLLLSFLFHCLLSMTLYSF